MNGKGSKPRPLSVTRKQFSDNWDRIFKGKKEKRHAKQTRRNPRAQR